MIIQSEEICRLSCMRQAVFFNLSPVFVDAPLAQSVRAAAL